MTNICQVDIDLLNSYELGNFPRIPISKHVYHDAEIIKQKNYFHDVSDSQKVILDFLKVSLDDAVSTKEKTREQRSECSQWFDFRKKRITSSVCHNFFIRQRNFELLCNDLLKRLDPSKHSKKLNEALNHGKVFEKKARNLYVDLMRMKLFHDVFVRKNWHCYYTFIVLVGWLSR